MASSNELILGYWNIRGAAGVARSLLAYCEIPYKDKTYSDKTPADKEEWFNKDKQQIGAEYPNLPYIIDGDDKITETTAIQLYIPIKAGKRELIGDTDEKFIRVQQAVAAIRDFRRETIFMLWLPGDFQTNKEEAFSKGNMKEKLELFEKRLEGQEWLTGFLSIADFSLLEGVEFIYDHEPSKLEPYPNLVAHRNRILEIPQIKAYRQSEKHHPLWLPSNIDKWASEQLKK